MSPNTLHLIVGCDAARALAARASADALAVWPAPPAPEAVFTTFTDADPAAVELAWVVPGTASTASLYDIVGDLQESRTPTLISADPAIDIGDRTGLVVLPADAAPEAVAAALAALASQVPAFEEVSRDLRLLRATRGGLAEQFGQMDEELRLAARLQQQFLPGPLGDDLPVSIDVLYRPAGYVSGDIYDVIRLDERYVGLFIADAVGHGVPAALLTMYIKRCLQPKAIDPADPRGYRLARPDEAIARLNRDMCRQQTETIRFATACYAVIDTGSGRVWVARAGHPYPLVFREGGEIQPIAPEGALLGVMEDEDFEVEQVTLKPGDRLIMYSDGLEAIFPTSRAERAALDAEDRPPHDLAQVHDLADAAPADGLNRLAGRIAEQAGSLAQADDVTVLSLTFHAAAEHAGDHKAAPVFAVA